VVIEGAVAGLYDVFTAESARGRGHAERLCRHLLGVAASAGAGVGYLQVDAGNDRARRIYRRLGFVDGYAYHYRTPPLGVS
jgi:ribosomal protein S18 acetylase RimI-like enzyme